MTIFTVLCLFLLVALGIGLLVSARGAEEKSELRTVFHIGGALLISLSAIVYIYSWLSSISWENEETQKKHRQYYWTEEKKWEAPTVHFIPPGKWTFVPVPRGYHFKLDPSGPVSVATKDPNSGRPVRVIDYYPDEQDRPQLGGIWDGVWYRPIGDKGVTVNRKIARRY